MDRMPTTLVLITLFACESSVPKIPEADLEGFIESSVKEEATSEKIITEDGQPPSAPAASENQAEASPSADFQLDSGDFHLFTNDEYGDFLVKIENDGFRASYFFSTTEGTISGTYDRDQETLTGYWCEFDGDNKETGEVIFQLSLTAKQLLGKWRSGDSGRWKEDWDLDLVENQEFPEILLQLFNQAQTCTLTEPLEFSP